jgi:hypothetical protein
VLEALVLTAVVVLSLTAYTHWAARRGQDFRFLGPILFTSLMIVLLFGIVQVCSSTLCLFGFQYINGAVLAIASTF